jgi:hypothetical protein
MMDIHIDVVGRLPVEKQLKLLALRPATRRRILSRVGRRLMKDARTRVRKQVDLKGMPYPPRWRRRSDGGKMLSRLVKQLTVSANSTEAKVTFRNPVVSRIGAEQQEGRVYTVYAKDAPRGGSGREGLAYYKKNATKRQANALVELGFKVKGRGKSGRRPLSRRATTAYITKNMTIGQAGWAMGRIMEWQGTSKKVSWITKLPARSFRGATTSEVDAYILDIYEQILKGK